LNFEANLIEAKNFQRV